MKKSKSSDNLDSWFGLLVGVIALLAIKSIFENDSSKIISQKGRSILSDDKKMQDINKKIHESEESNSHKEIVL